MNVFVLDNYDSFTYNLVHYLEANGADTVVKRNSDFDLNEIKDFDKIVLSPGPGLPKNTGGMTKVIKKYYRSKPILGVCLGHQALAEFFGGKLYNMTQIFHGVSSPIKIYDHYIFRNIDRIIEVGRYHSWCVKDLPSCLRKIAETEKGEIMAFSHMEFDLVGLQFHPESVMTTEGLNMIKNWLLHD